MNGGLKAALLVSGVALAGCTTTTQEVKVRPLDPAAAIRNKGDEVAVARGQLALGNVGLALEAFHIAQRARPYDPAPAAGIGDCYAAMGRYDIAESSYEVALSLAPRDHGLLLGLASIVERAGDLRRASDIRAEADRFQQAHLMASQAVEPAPGITARQAEAPQIAMTGSITVDLPPARPADKVTIAALHVSVPTLAADEHLAASEPPPLPNPERSPQPPSRDMTIAIEATSPRLERLSSGEIALVTTEKVVWAPKSPERPSLAAVLRSLPKARNRTEVATALVEASPISERPSLAAVLRSLPKARNQTEVATALVEPSPISDKSKLAKVPDTPTKLLNRAQVATAVRWIPLFPSAGKASVQVLNAAGRQGVAASARKILSGRGWRSVAIGNASLFRHASVVLYPKSRAALGRSLAAQFGVKARMIRTDRVVLLLGHDLAARIASQRRS